MRIVTAFLAILLAAPGVAIAQRVCVEEAAGVCLKYREAPRANPAQQAEQSLGMSRQDRRAAQAGLAAAGFYAGAIDGAIGAQSRRAIRAWQEDRGDLATGYLTRSQLSDLRAAAANAAPKAAQPTEIEKEAEAFAETDAPAAEPETTAADAPHPQPGRVYRHEYSNNHAIMVSMTAEPAGAGEMKLTFTINADSTFRQSCNAPIKGKFKCYLNQGGWNQRAVSGELPNVAVGEIRLNDFYQIFSENERFKLW